MLGLVVKDWLLVMIKCYSWALALLRAVPTAIRSGLVSSPTPNISPLLSLPSSGHLPLLWLRTDEDTGLLLRGDVRSLFRPIGGGGWIAQLLGWVSADTAIV